ncbi:MAG TPA: hypothetical protein VD813_11630, partial [Pseudonocardia sp.]|nr:hypothetical protein [Pseudonocardia sp.]
DDGEVALSMTTSGQGVSSSCQGACGSSRVSSSGGVSTMRTTAGSGARLALNQLRVEVVTVEGGSVELRLTPR